MGGQLSVDPSVHVVIVGGGFGDIAAARQLQSKGVPFTLVDLRDAFHHNVCSLRASVQSGFAQQTFIPYAKTFGECFRQGRVVQIDLEAQLRALELREVLFSHLILCTGCDGPFPWKFNEVTIMGAAIGMYEDMVKQIQMAQSVVVIGRGSTGIEMAAEIKTEYSHKKVKSFSSVYLCTSDAGLLSMGLCLPIVRQQAKKVLLGKGVQLVLGEKVSNLNMTQKDTTVITDKGTEITADLVIPFTGNKVSSTAYASALGAAMVDNGALRVNAHLQVEGWENVYAVGDCADVKEPKMAYHAGLHAGVAVTNIIHSLTNKPLTCYKPGYVTMLAGLDGVVGQFSGIRLARTLVNPQSLTNIYRCTLENIMTSCITVWYCNCAAYDRKALQQVVKTAQHIIGSALPSIQEIYNTRSLKKATKIMSDPTHPTHNLFVPLPSGRRFWTLQSHTTRLQNSFFPRTVKLVMPPLHPIIL
ncbi:AIFM2 factor, partial [Atractosteus spatula]|nr:AIFM2 factor [Atractosteus spatula]